MIVPDEVVEQIIAHARGEAPRECCGLLLGISDEIAEAVPVRNVASEPHRRYCIDPRDHFRAIRDARRRGRLVIGAYHSHPAGPAGPSETDRAEAFRDFVFLIVNLEAEPPAVSGWTFDSGNFVPVSLVRSNRR